MRRAGRRGRSAANPINSDERSLSSRFGNFSKGMPHAQSGVVEPAATKGSRRTYGREFRAFRRLARGSGMRLISPEAALGVHLEGGMRETFRLPPPPIIASAEAAAEMVEFYWQALGRDVSFSEYQESPVIERSEQDLRRVSRY